jgi:hypothetical protein
MGFKLKKYTNSIPGLNFSTSDREFWSLGLVYLGKNTKGTYLFFDPSQGVIYKWNEDSGLLRRNSDAAGDGRNCLCRKSPVAKDELLKVMAHYIESYRKNSPRLTRLSYDQYNRAKAKGIVR